MQENTYCADLYLRLSKDDGDRVESDSIANQRAMLLNYVDSMPDIRVHKIRIDAGYSGVNFNRPAFTEMLNDIKEGIVNCVIVKDFSRFGRNYVEVGRYTQVMFPRSGIRFIAVNDSYDSAKEQGYLGNIIVPFKNIINDAYSADISAKVRSHLEVKRKNGDFVGAFAVYGYMKDASNHNRLVVDELAADVVTDIFIMKINGLSAAGISEKLNDSGILSPMEYKRFSGLRYYSPFKQKISAKWQAKSVLRILHNEIYTGVLVQGKRTTQNYKIRKRIDVPKEQWARVENAHDAIIELSMFNTVQELLKQDTRATSQNIAVRPLSGIIFCAECQACMVHKTNTKNGKRYCYYVCSGHRANKEQCSTHMIRSDYCESAILMALKGHASSMLDIKKMFEHADEFSHSQGLVPKLTSRLEAKQEELRQYNEYKLSLYESYKDEIIPREDFINFKLNYDTKIQEAEASIIAIKHEIENAVEIQPQSHSWTTKFMSYMDADSLTRRMAVDFLEKVYVHDKGKISVNIRYPNGYGGCIDMGGIYGEKKS